jgi:hypothetical protein
MGFAKSTRLPGVNIRIPLDGIDRDIDNTKTSFCDAGKLNAAQNFGARHDVVANARHALSSCSHIANHEP